MITTKGGMFIEFKKQRNNHNVQFYQPSKEYNQKRKQFEGKKSPVQVISQEPVIIEFENKSVQFTRSAAVKRIILDRMEISFLNIFEKVLRARKQSPTANKN